MIGRADIEGSKSNVAMNAWLPQPSYPCGLSFRLRAWFVTMSTCKKQTLIQMPLYRRLSHRFKSSPVDYSEIRLLDSAIIIRSKLLHENMASLTRPVRL